MDSVQCYKLQDRQWQALRRDVTEGIRVKKLVAGDVDELNAAYTEVSPGGEFRPHADEYHHLMFFLQGKGTISAGGDVYIAAPGVVVEIPAGTVHGYKNTGDEAMTLITLNIPAGLD